MSPCDCPKFERCNASLCPVASHPSDRGIHIPDDPVCVYLLEAGRGKELTDSVVAQECRSQLPALVRTYPDIQRQLDITGRGKPVPKSPSKKQAKGWIPASDTLG